MLKLKNSLTRLANHDDGARGVLLVCGAALLLSVGALNGGALSASAFDTFKTQAQTLLTSSYVIAIALILFVVGIWQAKSGKGWAVLEGLLVVLALAFIGPPLFTTVATSTRSAQEVAAADRAYQASEAVPTAYRLASAHLIGRQTN